MISETLLKKNARNPAHTFTAGGEGALEPLLIAADNYPPSRILSSSRPAQEPAMGTWCHHMQDREEHQDLKGACGERRGILSYTAFSGGIQRNSRFAADHCKDL